MKYFLENAKSVKKKVIIDITNINILVLISSQWQVLRKVKLNKKCSTANTQDKIWRLQGEQLGHENSDPKTLKATGKTKPTEVSCENGMRA